MTNVMRASRIEKVVLSAGAVGPELEKAKKLLEIITGKKAQIIKTGPNRRIPAFDVKPNMELGTRVTLRGKEAIAVLRRLLGAVDNIVKARQVESNHFSFGIKEYIEIPGMEYIRELGIRGFNATVVFKRAGTRVKRKKIKQGHVPRKQDVSAEEIIELMTREFKTEFR